MGEERVTARNFILRQKLYASVACIEDAPACCTTWLRALKQFRSTMKDLLTIIFLSVVFISFS